MKKLPEGWREVRLKNFTKIVTGNTPSTKETNNFGEIYPWVTPTDIKSKKYIYDTERKLSEKGFLKARQLPANTVLITSIASIGKNAILKLQGSCNQQINAILPSNVHDSDFIYYWFENNIKKLKKISGQTAVPIINKTDFSNIKISLPPLEEQKKIAEILSTVDQKIDFVDKQIEETETLKKGLMQKLLTQGIGHSEFKDSEIGRIPVAWEVKKISDILTIKYGKNQKEVEDSNGKYPILGTGGLIGYANKYLYNKPSVLIGRKGTIDKPQYIDKPFWTVDTLFYSDIKLGNIPLFVYYLFLTIDWKRYNEASGVPSLSVSNIHNIKVLVPPLEEQKQIAEILSTVDQKIENLKAKKEAFEELKKGLMQKLLTGEVRVK
jgi:type I restriction enzyme S subunit